MLPAPWRSPRCCPCLRRPPSRRSRFHGNVPSKVPRRARRNPTMPTRKCGSSGSRASSGSSPARTRNCNTATASLRSGCASSAARRPRPAASPRSRSPARPLRHPRRSPIRSRHRRQQGYPQAQPGYGQQPQVASPAPIVQDPAAPQAGGRRRGDAFDPEPEPQRPRCAARARRRSDADRERSAGRCAGRTRSR